MHVHLHLVSSKLCDTVCALFHGTLCALFLMSLNTVCIVPYFIEHCVCTVFHGTLCVCIVLWNAVYLVSTRKRNYISHVEFLFASNM